MARVQLFEGGNIQYGGVTSARFRPADYGPSPFAEGLKGLGKMGSEAVQKVDEIQDVQARIEANRLAVEHTKLAGTIDRRVRETLGEGAHAAAESGAQDLEKGTAEILGRASPRARMLLQNEVAQRNVAKADGFYTHGFREQTAAFETSSQAKIDNILELASQEEDEGKALSILAPIREINTERARFFGRDVVWQGNEDRKAVSGFFKSRTLKLAVGENGSAYAAIEYATKNREFMSDADYNAIVNAYNDNALDELAAQIVDGAPPPSATTAVTESDDGQPQRRLDPAAYFKTWMVPHEGSTYVTDSNGRGVKFGFNEQYNPGVNVKGLTLESATQLFINNHWKRAGAGNLPPALAAVHMDTFFLNERQAGRILRESGGDVDKYLDMRASFLQSLVRQDPGKYGKYEKAWTNRTRDLRQFAARQGTDGTPLPLPVGPDSSLEAFRSEVMARTDIGLALKRKIIDRMEGRRSEARQEEQIRESSAAEQLTLQAAQLGDKFTDIKLLDPGAWMLASGTTKAQLISAAKANKENKPLSPQAAARVGFLQTFSPQALADPKVLRELGAMGVPQRMITQLAQQGGQARGTIAGAQPDYVERGTLEALARPAFEARGIRLWTTDEKQPKKRAAEQQEEAARALQLMNYLEVEGRAWALANPGKKADTKTIQQWVARAMVSTTATGKAFGTLNDDQVIASYGQRNVDAVRQKLRQNGLQPTSENVANYLRRLWSMTPHGKP